MKFLNKKVEKTIQLFIWPIALVRAAFLIYKTDFCELSITWKEFISLITVVIWPLTVIICFLFFRRKLIEIMGSISSFRAGPDGIEFTTFEKDLKATEEQFHISETASGGISKSSGSLNMNLSLSGTPFQQLMELRGVLTNKIGKRAEELNIPIENASSSILVEKLKEVGGITIKKARSFNTLLALINKADKKVTQSQVDRIKNMVLNFSIK